MINHEPIIWTDSYLTGIERIDEQHKVLVNTLNEANSRLSNGVTRRTLDHISRDLLSYALYHFETEEGLMQQYDYAGLSGETEARHRQEHRSFSKKIVSLRDGLRDGRLFTREELLTFLNNWLVNHILHTDKHLAQFLIQHDHIKSR